MTEKPTTCVVICYWTGQPIKNLFRLLDQMLKVDAGSSFDTVLVVNGGDLKPVVLPPRFAGLRAKVINRANHGYNIEAWDVGWRATEGNESFLFLQSECFLKGRNWIADFEFRMARDRGIGLLGEQGRWEQMTWEFIRASTDRDLGDSVWDRSVMPLHPIDTIRSELERNGYPLTDLGTHLTSIILFTSRAILEEVGGFPRQGNTYWEAVSGEVGISRVIASKGYRISQIRDDAFSLVGHRQYTKGHRLASQVRNHLRSALKKVGLKR